METCCLEVLNESGHLTLNWHPDNPDEVAKAKAEFSALRVAGFAFFRDESDTTPMQRLGKSGALVVKAREFDPKAKRTVAVRPMRGG